MRVELEPAGPMSKVTQYLGTVTMADGSYFRIAVLKRDGLPIEVVPASSKIRGRFVASYQLTTPVRLELEEAVLNEVDRIEASAA